MGTPSWRALRPDSTGIPSKSTGRGPRHRPPRRTGNARSPVSPTAGRVGSTPGTCSGNPARLGSGTGGRAVRTGTASGYAPGLRGVLGAARGNPGGPRHFGTGCGAFSAITPPGHAPGLRGGLLRFATLLSLLSERTASEDASVRTAVSHRIRCELRREAAFNSALRRTTTLSSAPPIGAVQNDRAQVELDRLGRQCWESAIRQTTLQRRFGRSDGELFDEELCGDDQDERRRFPGARLHSLTVASSPNATARISAVLCLRRRLRLLGSGWQAFTRCLAEQLDDVPVRDTDPASATRSARLAANRPLVEHDTVWWSLPDILQLERDSTVDVIVAAGGQHAARRAAALSRLRLSCPPPADHREV